MLTKGKSKIKTKVYLITLKMFPFIFMKKMFHFPLHTATLPRLWILRNREYSTERKLPLINNSHFPYERTTFKCLCPHL